MQCAEENNCILLPVLSGGPVLTFQYITSTKVHQKTDCPQDDHRNLVCKWIWIVVVILKTVFSFLTNSRKCLITGKTQRIEKYVVIKLPTLDQSENQLLSKTTLKRTHQSPLLVKSVGYADCFLFIEIYN